MERWRVVMLALACAGLFFARKRIHPKLRARNQVERVVNVFLILCSLVAILTTIGIVAVAAVRGDPVLQQGAAGRVPVRPALEPADGHPRRSGGVRRRVRRRAAVHRHHADRRHRHGGRRAAGPVDAPSTCRNTRPPGCAAPSSLFWRSWPASRPSSTASSRH